VAASYLNWVRDLLLQLLAQVRLRQFLKSFKK
jgi:hypothetical protein